MNRPIDEHLLVDTEQLLQSLDRPHCLSHPEPKQSSHPELCWHSRGSKAIRARLSTRSGRAFQFGEFYGLEMMWPIDCRRAYDVRHRIVLSSTPAPTSACSRALRRPSHPHAIVHALEPMPPTYERLIRTVRDNRLGARIHCHQYALRSSSGEAVALASASQMAHVTTARGEATCRRRRITLGELIEKIAAPAIDLLKMDIEGREYDVLLSASAATLQIFRRIIVDSTRRRNISRPTSGTSRAM